MLLILPDVATIHVDPTKEKLPRAISVIFVVGLALVFSMPGIVHASPVSPPSFGLDGLGNNASCLGCLSQLLTTSTANDVIIVVIGCDFSCSSSNSSIVSVTDSQGLTYSQRTVFSPDSYSKLWEYYAIAPTPVQSDNITVSPSSASYFVGMQVFAVRGANLQTIFDPNPSLPARQSCFHPGQIYIYDHCSILIQTSNQDFIIAATTINDDGPCTVPSGYTTIGGGDFEVDYRIGGAPNSSLEFGCSDNDAMATLVDAVQSATGFQAHSPILVNGNAQFTPSNGVISGTGTRSDPFVIEGWDISADQTNGIEIRNTDDYFVIRNVFLHSGSANNYNGTVLDHVQNGLLELSTVYGDNYGVSIVSSGSINVQDNIIENNVRGGVAVLSSSNMVIARNDLSNNPAADGESRGTVLAFNTEGLTVDANTFLSDGYSPVMFTLSRSFAVTNNNIRLASQAGINILQSSDFTISSNQVEGNNYYNIFVADSGNFSIDSNQVLCGSSIRDLPCQVSGPIAGIEVSQSSSLGVTRNTIYPSANLGLSLDYATDATLSYNSIYVESQTGTSDSGTAGAVSNSGRVSVFANFFAGAHQGLILNSASSVQVYHNNFFANGVQAIDNQGTNDSWDNGYPSGGNFWTDYSGVDNCNGVNQDLCSNPDGIGDTPYVFNGNQDNYPMMHNIGQETLPNDPSGVRDRYNFPAWNVITPVWSLKEGVLDGSGLTGSYTPAIAAADTFPHDRSVSVSFKTVTNGYNDFDTAWIMGMWRDSYHNVALVLSPLGLLRLEVAYGNAPSCGDICADFYDVQTSLSPFDWHRANLRFTGNSVVVSIDGTVFFNILDGNIGTLGVNTILLASWGNSESQFSDTTITW